MSRLLYTAVIACSLLAFSGVSARRSRTGLAAFRGGPRFGSRQDVSEYFFNYLKAYFPNASRPSTTLVQAEYQEMDISGGELAPVVFTVGVLLHDTVTGSTVPCTAVVNLGNPISGDLYSLYFGEEASLRNCPHY